MAEKNKTQKKLRIRQVRSRIGGTVRQREILNSLGLRRMNQEVVLPANPSILGMVRKIPHLLKVVEE